MYGYLSSYPPFPYLPGFSNTQAYSRFAYPAIDTKIFSHSIKTFPVLMHQANKLISRLGNPDLTYKIMAAAQRGEKKQVEALVKSIGLTVPVSTHYSPTGIIFILHVQENLHDPKNCCSLSLALKWGR